MTIELLPMTRERMHEFYRGFTFDPDTFMDMSLYERAQSLQYDAQKVDFLFDAQSKEENRTAFAVMLHDDVIGEVEMKHIDADHKTCELIIHMQNDSVKNKGYGTQAEMLAVHHAFSFLGMEHILADSILKNTRSRHVLEKLGFEFLYEKNGFSHYCLEKKDWMGKG